MLPHLVLGVRCSWIEGGGRLGDESRAKLAEEGTGQDESLGVNTHGLLLRSIEIVPFILFR